MEMKCGRLEFRFGGIMISNLINVKVKYKSIDVYMNTLMLNFKLN